MKILDCTLRDGGYYTNWDFKKDLVDSYFQAFNALPVDYLEIGYRSNPMKDYLGEFFYCPPYLLNRLKAESNKKIVIMLNEKDVKREHVKNLLAPCRDTVSMIRIAVDPQFFSRAIPLAEEIKSLGFEVAFNVMYMSKWKEEAGFLNEIKAVEGIADYLYLVDSFGGVYPKDVINIMNMVKERTTCPLGFHSHNNIELALINTLTAVEHGAAIVDATVTGMGRGAGNLKTELLLAAINANNNVDVDFNALSNIVDAFEKLREEHQWGTNLPYMISGANSLPQKDVMEWVTRRFYSFNSIIRALQNQKKGVNDNQKLEVFRPLKKYTSSIIIGGGTNAISHASAIKEFIGRRKDICLIHASSKNAGFYKDLNVDQFFCLVGNEGFRLEKVFSDLGDFSGHCVLPPFPRKMGTYIPPSCINKSYELSSVAFSNKFQDSHTALALQTSIDVGVKEIFLVGYDGYSDSVMKPKEFDLFNENVFLFDAIQKYGIELNSLTITKYSGPKLISVYSLLV
jgi:4-hydroxy 2-oxovalerate aldolase